MQDDVQYSVYTTGIPVKSSYSETQEKKRVQFSLFRQLRRRSNDETTYDVVAFNKGIIERQLLFRKHVLKLKSAWRSNPQHCALCPMSACPIVIELGPGRGRGKTCKPDLNNHLNDGTIVTKQST